MNRFAALIDALVYTRSRNGKLALIARYLRETPDPDRGWALAALTGGLSFAADGGVEYATSRLTLRFAPEITVAQNLPGNTIPVTAGGYQQTAYPLHGSFIDLPQRFGTGPNTRSEEHTSELQSH